MRRLNNPLRSKMKVGLEGQRLVTAPYKMVSAVNTKGLLPEVQTITCSAPTIGVAYSFSFDDLKLTTSKATTVVADDLATLVAKAITDDPLVNGAFTATAAGAVVTVTGYNAGESYTLTSLSGADLVTAVTQPAAEAEQIPFGRFVISESWSHNLMVIELPDAATLTTLNAGLAGVACRDNTLAQEDQDLSGYNSGRIAALLRKGHVYMKPEEAPTSIQSGVFVRVAVDGLLDKIGGVSATAGTGLLEVTSRAKWVHSTSSEEGLYVLAIDLA